jgi:hypothetical protein
MIFFIHLFITRPSYAENTRKPQLRIFIFFVFIYLLVFIFLFYFSAIYRRPGLSGVRLAEVELKSGGGGGGEGDKAATQRANELCQVALHIAEKECRRAVDTYKRSQKNAKSGLLVLLATNL